jgi:hypothetical protein
MLDDDMQNTSIHRHAILCRVRESVPRFLTLRLSLVSFVSFVIEEGS